jgi:NitT/TauT family transport system substrate-binding protein
MQRKYRQYAGALLIILGVLLLVTGCGSSPKAAEPVTVSSSGSNAGANAGASAAVTGGVGATGTGASTGTSASTGFGANTGAGSAAANVTLTLLSPKAPPLFPALVMESKVHPNWKFKVETWETIEQLLVRVQSGDTPFLAAPLNIGANIAQKGLPLQLLNVNTWGSMYLVTVSEARSLSDLVGETVYIPGQSGPPDILTRYLVNDAGLKEKITLQYSTIPEMVQMLAGGKIKHAVLPEPILSGLRMNMGDKLKEVIDFQQVWQQKFAEGLPQTGVFVNSKWAEGHKAEVEQFQQAYKAALNEVVQNPKAAASVATATFGIPVPVIETSLSKMTLQFMDAREAKPLVERYFNILLKADPNSIGGSLPNEQFYYKP